MHVPPSSISTLLARTLPLFVRVPFLSTTSVCPRHNSPLRRRRSRFACVSAWRELDECFPGHYTSTPSPWTRNGGREEPVLLPPALLSRVKKRTSRCIRVCESDISPGPFPLCVLFPRRVLRSGVESASLFSFSSLGLLSPGGGAVVIRVGVGGISVIKPFQGNPSIHKTRKKPKHRIHACLFLLIDALGGYLSAPRTQPNQPMTRSRK